MELVFDSALSDMVDEWEEAMRNNKPGKARWVSLRGHIVLLQSMFAHSMAATARLAWSTFKVLGG